MNDNPSARATHEKGVKHQDNLARSKSLLSQSFQSEYCPAGLSFEKQDRSKRK